MFFKNYKKWETEFAGRKFTLETGKMAGLATPHSSQHTARPRCSAP